MTSNLDEEGAVSPGAQAGFVAETPKESPSSRILSLDVLKGLAVLGGLAVSIWIFGGFSANQQTQLLLHPSGGNYHLFATVSLLLEGKMMALICLIFGAGMLLYMANHQRANIAKAHDYMVRRLIWLIAFGILNAIIFLWPNDLLFQLGVAGILLIPFLHLSPKKLVVAATLFTLIFFGKQYWNYSDDKKALHKYEAVMLVEKKIKQDSVNIAKKDSVTKANKAIAASTPAKDTTGGKMKSDTLTKEQKKDKEAWEGLLKDMKYDSAKDVGKIKAMRNTSYGELWNHLLPISQSREAQWTYKIGVWALPMMILLGMALFKLGFFTNRFSSRQYLLVAGAGITIGLLLGWYRLYFNNGALLDYTKYIKGHFLPFDFFIPLERSAMAIGYAGLVMFLTRSAKPGWCWRALADTGRLSLTNYLAQSIICTLFFTGFGMNYYSHLNQWQLYLFVAEIWLIQVVFSVFWLRYFRQGPAEWLWHCLVELKWLPLKKQAPLAGTDPIPANA